MGDLVKQNESQIGKQVENVPIINSAQQQNNNLIGAPMSEVPMSEVPMSGVPMSGVETKTLIDTNYKSARDNKNYKVDVVVQNMADKNNIEIEPLNIVMKTNKDSQVNLTAKLFVFDDNKQVSGDYPFLCTNVEYDRGYLDRKLTFFEKVQVFFSESEFEKFILEPKRDIIIDDNIKHETINKNIMLMLETFFPISFPIKDDVTTIFKSNSLFDFGKMLNKVFRESQHVYLNIDHPSTVTQVIWLDTVSSNPVYVQLYELMKKYKRNLISYVLDKFARKTTEVPFNEVIRKIEDIIKRASVSFENSKELSTFYKSIEVLKRTFDKMDTESKKTKLCDRIETLKKLLLKKTIKFDEELTRLESSIKVNEADDKQQIITAFDKYKSGTIDDNYLRRTFENYMGHGSTWWKLYFIFAGFKKNTSAYNSFVEEYVKRHVLQSRENNERSWYYYNTQSSNESKFYRNLSDLNFHFEFLAKIEDFITKRRRSLTKEISEIFQEGETFNRVQLDKFLSLFKRQRKTYAGVDRVQQSKSKDEEDKKTNENQRKFYEIYIGVALVGGKVPNAPSNFWCAFNSAKLANDYKFLTKYDVGEIQLYPYVEIEETPPQIGQNANVPYGTILNLKKKGGGRRTRNKRSFAKKTRKRSFQRDFQEKKANNN
jgi:hypothetical protein